MKVRMEKGVAILAPHGWLTDDEQIDDFAKTARDLLEHGRRCLLVDLANVVHLNSLSLGQFVALHTSYANRQGRMALCNVDRRIQNILVITKLSLVFDAYGSEREALESFTKSGCPE